MLGGRLEFSVHRLGTAYRMSTFRKLKRKKILSRPAAGPFLPTATLLDDLVRGDTCSTSVAADDTFCPDDGISI